MNNLERFFFAFLFTIFFFLSHLLYLILNHQLFVATYFSAAFLNLTSVKFFSAEEGVLLQNPAEDCVTLVPTNHVGHESAGLFAICIVLV